jgi:hypothetical protein
MKGSAKDLSKLVKVVHQKFGSTSSDLTGVLSDLHRIQCEKESTQKMLEMSHICKEVTQLMLKVKEEIENDRHYQAMKIIEIIQNEYNHNAHLFPMKKMLEMWLPIAVNKLLYSARCDADSFLEEMRTNATRIIGNTVVLKMVKGLLNYENNQNGIYRTLVNSNSALPAINWRADIVVNNSTTNFNNFVVPRKVSVTSRYFFHQLPFLFKIVPANYNSGLTQSLYLFPLVLQVEDLVPFHYENSLTINNEGNLLLDDKLVADMSCVHKVLHLYSILGNVQNYYDHYAHIRYETFKTKLVKNFEIAIESMGLMKTIPFYLEELMGFFMIEIIIYRLIETNYIFFNFQELNRLWEEALNEFLLLCTKYAITLNSPTEIIQIKEELLLILYLVLDNDMFNFHSHATSPTVTNNHVGSQMTSPKLVSGDTLWNIDILLNTIVRLWELFDALHIQILHSRVYEFIQKCSFQPYFVNSYNDFFLQIKFYQLDLIELNNENLLNKSYIVNNLSNPSEGEKKKEKAASLSLNRIEANLDALEMELSLSNNNLNINPVVSTSSTSTSSTHDRGSSNAVNNDARREENITVNQSNFLPQTYPFSEFVPLVLKELHATIIRLVFYGLIPPPDARGLTINSNMTGTNSGTASSSKLSAKKAPQYFNHNSDGASGSENPSQGTSLFASTTTRASPSLVLIEKVSNLKLYELICRSMKSYYHLIVNVLTTELLRDGNETILSKAVQIFIDSSAVSLSTDFIFNTLLKKSILAMYPHDSVDTKAIEQCFVETLGSLRALTSKAQDLIFELLSIKIEDLLESSLIFIALEPETFVINPNYLPANYSGGNANVNNLINTINVNSFNTFLIHENIDSIIEFLQITFMCLTHLPQIIRETIYYISCTKLSHGIIQYLLSPKVARINVFGLVSLDADCKKLQQFAESCGIIHLRECFDELNQMISATLSLDFHQIGDNHALRNSKYPRINPYKFAAIVDKVSSRILLPFHSIKLKFCLFVDRSFPDHREYDESPQIRETCDQSDREEAQSLFFPARRHHGIQPIISFLFL